MPAQDLHSGSSFLAHLASHGAMDHAQGPDADPEHRAVGTLLAGMVLALAGGFLDAFLYLHHGHVFAGAMTGNAVLCGTALLGKDHREAVRHALPLLAFFVGVWLAEILADRLPRHAVLLGLGGEIAGLLLASCLPPAFPDLVFVSWIALLAAFQISSFRKVDRFAYSSTFITGDLRTAITGLYDALQPSKRAVGLQQARDLGLVVLAFLAGAVSAAACSPCWENRVLWLPVAELTAVLCLVLRRTRTQEREPAQAS